MKVLISIMLLCNLLSLTMRDFRELDFWERSYKFALKIYEVTKIFSKEEIFGLTSQLRRSVYSIPTNIAEGCGKESKKELFRYLQISLASLSETENHLMFSRDLHYINEKEYDILNDELQQIKKMISSYTAKIKQDLLKI